MTPTPEELDAIVYAQYPDFDRAHDGPSIDDVRAMMQAALAKWGTPTPAGGPVGAVRYAEGWAGVEWYAKAPPAGTRLYTAPPVREPLTPDEALDAFCKTTGIRQHVQAFVAGVRFAERHHGITKGGKL